MSKRDLKLVKITLFYCQFKWWETKINNKPTFPPSFPRPIGTPSLLTPPTHSQWNTGVAVSAEQLPFYCSTLLTLLLCFSTGPHRFQFFRINLLQHGFSTGCRKHLFCHGAPLPPSLTLVFPCAVSHSQRSLLSLWHFLSILEYTWRAHLCPMEGPLELVRKAVAGMDQF